MRSRARTLWERIREPRLQRAGFLIIYAFHVCAGLGVLLGDPVSITALIGHLLTNLWAGFLILGGLLGFVSVLPGWNFVERIAIISVMVGIAILSVIILASRIPTGYALALWSFVTAWLVVFGLRAWEIRLYTVAPKV